MQNWKLKYNIILLLFIFSCEAEIISPTLNGIFATDGVELVFDSGVLTGQTKCNSLNGEYSTHENYINIDLGSTKVYCINEYNTVYFRDVYKYEIKGKELILFGNDFEIMLYNIK